MHKFIFESIVSIYEKFPRWTKLRSYFEFNAKLKHFRDFVTHMVNYFESGDKTRNPLSDAIFNGNVSFIVLLLQSPWDFSARDENGMTPLHLACQYGSKNIVMLLLKVAEERCIDINMESGMSLSKIYLFKPKSTLDLFQKSAR